MFEIFQCQIAFDETYILEFTCFSSLNRGVMKKGWKMMICLTAFPKLKMPSLEPFTFLLFIIFVSKYKHQEIVLQIDISKKIH